VRATTIIIKMGKARFVAVTLVPLVWLGNGNFHSFMAQGLRPESPHRFFCRTAAQLASNPAANVRLIFNDRLDAFVTGTLIVMVALILIESVVEWARVLSGRQTRQSERVAICGYSVLQPRSRDEAI